MHTKKLVLGALLGGLALFFWSFVAHMPPVGTAGYAAVPAAEEERLLTAVRSSMKERAIYLLPRLDLTSTPEQQRA